LPQVIFTSPGVAGNEPLLPPVRGSRSIMESGLGRRIPLRGTQDELDHLAQNLNSMLERIEGLMAEVKHVSENVAHDLLPCSARLVNADAARVSQRILKSREGFGFYRSMS
jgi:methyl-accepting chemotaxis protein